jgi:hypothetical protein
VAYPVNKLPAFVERKRLLPFFRDPVTEVCVSQFSKGILILSSIITLGVPNDLFPSFRFCFAYVLYAFLFVTSPPSPPPISSLFYSIAPVVCDKVQIMVILPKHSSYFLSLRYNFPPVLKLSLVSSLRAKDQIRHRYKVTGKITLWIFSFFSDEIEIDLLKRMTVTL